MPVILDFERLRKDSKFKVSLGYTIRLNLKKTKINLKLI